MAFSLLAFQATRALASASRWDKSATTPTAPPTTCGCTELTPETSTTAEKWKDCPTECRNFLKETRSLFRLTISLFHYMVMMISYYRNLE